MNYPEPLNPQVEKSNLSLENYSRAGNSYLFDEEKLVILKSGNRYSIDFSKLGAETRIKTDSNRNEDLDSYVLAAEHFRLLNEGISLGHFSTLSDGENAYVLTGPPNTGKTGINLALNLRGFNFMADEDAPVTESGEALPLDMPLSIGNNNIEEFQDLLDELEVNYSWSKANTFKQVKRLPLPLVDQALDRFIEPVKIDLKELNFEQDSKEIKKSFYIQPENRKDIKIEDMRTEEFCRKMSIWNNMHRDGVEEIYRIWRTEFDVINENIEKSKQKDREILYKCFKEVEIKKLRVPLERQPRKIAEFIEEQI